MNSNERFKFKITCKIQDNGTIIKTGGEMFDKYFK